MLKMTTQIEILIVLVLTVVLVAAVIGIRNAKTH